MVLLIGNYPRDRQQSMQRFAAMMSEGLARAGVAAELVQPEAFFGKFSERKFFAKWLGYLDKFVIFPWKLRRKIAALRPSVVHICDHSNAMYASRRPGPPTVVTAHDLLAVRGALGEETDTPASRTGKFLQRWILKSLRRATAIACVSRATCDDVERLVRQGRAQPRLEVITSGLNYPFQKLTAAETRARLAQMPQMQFPFALHVGSNHPRKNRAAVLRIFSRVQKEWHGHLVFAGDELSPQLRALAQKLGIDDRIIEIPNASSEILEALYNSAIALIFPSRFEGFGWPIAEAQACGCPVLCSNAAPMSEVAGAAGLLHSIEDEAAFAADLLHLTTPAERALWSEKGLRNAERFETRRMIDEYIALYRAISDTPLAS